MFRGVAGLVIACVMAAGCGGGDIFVRGQLFKPSPAVPSLEDSKGDYARLIYTVVDNETAVPDGGVFIIFSDGTTLTGQLNRVEGYFDWTYSFPTLEDIATLHQAGNLTFNGSALQGAVYDEEALYRDDTKKSYHLAMNVTASNFLILNGTDEQGARIESSVLIALGDRIEIVDTWDLQDVYRLEVETIFSLDHFQSPAIHQAVTRDDRTTPGAVPDREALFEIDWDGAGFGFEYWHYDGGVESRSEVQFESSGSAQRRLTYEDPATNQSPDGQGVFNFNNDASGDGFYIEKFDDGSEMNADYVYRSTYFDDVFWTYNVAGTPIDVDVDGEIYYQPDRSGTGLYRRYDPAGAIERCDYLFDTTGAITQMDCANPAAVRAFPPIGRRQAGLEPFAGVTAGVTAP